MSRNRNKNNDKLPWHKLKAAQQNWIIIGVSAFVSLFVIGVFCVISWL